MLYRYIIENFRSFRDRTEWSLIPTISKDANESGVQIQKINAIYGANASGKTTIVRSLSYMRDVIVRSNSILSKSSNQCYKMDSAYFDKPTVFNVQISCGGILFDYGFAYLYKKGQIVSEWLYELGNMSEKKLFTRELKDNGYAIDIPNVSGEKETTIIGSYKSDMQKAYSTLLLVELARKNNSLESVIAAKTVVEWFDNLTVIFPDSKFNLTSRVSEDEKEVNLLYSEHFKRFGIDISQIKLVNIPSKYLNIKEEIKEDIHEDLRKDEANGLHSQIIVNVNSTPILFELDEAGDLYAQEVVFIHEYVEGKGATLRWQEESDGTNRLFDIIPIAQLIKRSPSVVVVDELDRSLHTNLTKHFVRYIKELLVNSDSQFLFTTHDTLLMDTSLIKRDEIWMVEKKDGASRLIPLAKYKLKNSEYIRENYLLGRYGGVAELQ